MATSNEPPVMYEQIDLAWWVRSLIHGKWIVLASVALCVVVGAAMVLVVLPPKYSTSILVTLPPVSAYEGLGLSDSQYHEFALSDAVLNHVRDNLAFDGTVSSLRDMYDTALAEGSRTLAVDVASRDAAVVTALGSGWLDAYKQQLNMNIQAQFAELQRPLSEREDALSAQLEASEQQWVEFQKTDNAAALQAQIENLDLSLATNRQMVHILGSSAIPINEATLREERNRLGRLLSNAGMTLRSSSDDISDLKNYINQEMAAATGRTNLLEDQFSQLKSDIVDAETTLRELTITLIPNDTTRLETLSERLPDIPETIEGQIPLYTDNTGKIINSEVQVINPIFFDLSKQLEDTRTNLDIQRLEAQTLVSQISSMSMQLTRTGEQLALSQQRLANLEDMVLIAGDIDTLERTLVGQRAELDFLKSAILTEETETLALRGNVASIISERDTLLRDLEALRADYVAANEETRTLLSVVPQLNRLSAISVIRRPSQPIAPSLLRTVLLLVGSAAGGVVLGGIVALFRNLYTGEQVTAPAAGGAMATGGG